ncbi:NAD(P)H-binding protein [Psychroserpens sp. MEBiC05023]
MNSKICVIGCGWLGFPLAKKLVEHGIQVHGSTTSKEKSEQLELANIKPFIIKLSPFGIEGDINACLSGCDILILNTPPGLRRNPEYDYVKQMKHLITSIETSTIQKVLFIGSTSVYDDDVSFSRVTEESPKSTSVTALKLLTVENLFRKNTSFKTTILRFSGLFAKDRHPAITLSGRTQLKNGNAPVNLIHRNDCISIIEKLLKQDIWNETFNASIPSNISKREYYTSTCQVLKIPIPHYNTSSISKGKFIDSTKLVQLLDYEFQVKL